MLASEVPDGIRDLLVRHRDQATDVLADQIHCDDAGFQVPGEAISECFADIDWDNMSRADRCRHGEGGRCLHADDFHSSALAADHPETGGQGTAAYFFFNDPRTTEIYTHSLHDGLLEG